MVAVNSFPVPSFPPVPNSYSNDTSVIRCVDHTLDDLLPVIEEARAFTRWKEAGVFSRHILSKGSRGDAAVPFHRFMDRDADPQALLKRCG